MKVIYDPQTDSLRLLFSSAPIEESDEDRPGVTLDYDTDDNHVGLEILDAGKRTDNPRVRVRRRGLTGPTPSSDPQVALPMMVTSIETPRLILRPMRAEDVDDLPAVLGDPRVMASFGEPPFDRARMERWVRRNLDHQERYGYGLFTLVLRANGLVIGDCGLERMDEGNVVQAELGYDLRADCWNRGLATEAAAAVRDYATRALGLPRLISQIRVGNAASRRVAEKIGMRLEAEVERHGYRYWVFVRARDDVEGAAG